MSARVLCRIDEQLLDVRVFVAGERLQAPGALCMHRRAHRSGDEDSLHHRLESQIQLEISAFGHPGKSDSESSRSYHRSGEPLHRPRPSTEVANADDQRFSGVEGVQGSSESLHEDPAS